MDGLSRGPVAFFVLLAGAAGAGVVAADFIRDAALGGDGGASGLLGGGEVALLGAGEFAFELVDGRRGRTARG
jgi:hypothetical protein